MVIHGIADHGNSGAAIVTVNSPAKSKNCLLIAAQQRRVRLCGSSNYSHCAIVSIALRIENESSPANTKRKIVPSMLIHLLGMC